MNRITWVDISKYIFIMAVILEHIESTTDELACFFSPFFVLGFFFVAGYTHRAGQPVGKFMLKKVRTLLLPWLIFSVLDIAVSQVVSFSEHSSIWDELFWNFLQIRGQGDQIWFVAALFMAFIPFYFFIEWYSRKPSTGKRRLLFIIISLVLFIADHLYSKYTPSNIFSWGTSALPWHLEYLFQGMFYMTLGYMFKETWEVYFDRANTCLFRIVFFFVYALIIYLPYLTDVPLSLFSFSAVYITPILGILLTVSISKTIPANRYMCYVGQNTLIYFALHGKAFSFIEKILSRFASEFYTSILENTLLSNAFAILFTFALSLVLLVPTYIINRWLPFMVGRKRTKTADP